MPPQQTSTQARPDTKEEPIAKTPEIVLPRLPVPPLEQTIQRYLQSVKPFVNDEEFKVTIALAQEFSKQGGVGQKLQQFLKEREQKNENWLSDWWLDYAYLGYRPSLVINSNAAMNLPHKDIRTQEQQLKYAASYIASALKFKKILDDGKLPQEKMGPHFLDMSQHYRLFATCRIPGETVDTLRLFKKGEYSKHVVVVHNYNFFSMPVYGEDGTPLNEDQLVEQLKIVVANSLETCENPVGILTSEHRDNWYKTRQEIIKDEHNRFCLDQIETSLAVICLDKSYEDTEKKDISRDDAAAHHVMHGDGSTKNTPNRWFDKCFQFVIGSNGTMGLAYEHSPAEGQPVTQLIDFIEEKFAVEDTRPGAVNFALPQRLDFVVNEEVKKAISQAKINIDKLIDTYEVGCFNFTGFGKDYIKAQNLSPDSFIQMALQLAFYKIHGVCGAQYESAMTRMYMHGRTETIRSCTKEAVNFAKLMCDSAASNEEKATALREAIAAHKKYVTNAVIGHGVDRHLLGLRLAAKESGMEVPELLLDPAFTRSSYMRLSTSQVIMKCQSFVFFGPLVNDGYSCCYNPNAEGIRVSVSAYNSCPETSYKKFFTTLDEAFREMRSVLSVRSARG